jgi:tetratricopeptide (TPR) repeat protein
MGSRVKRKKTTPSAGSRSSHTRRDPLKATVVCILLAAIVWVAFGQTLHHEFVNYDDSSYVYANPKIIDGLSPGNLAWAFTHAHAANWHPLTTISHMLDCQLYGLQPWGHHLSNILLHAAAVILLFLALWRLTDNLWACAFVATLFAIHPARVESVAWVAERKDVLSGVFFMLALLAYAGYAQAARFSLTRYIMVVVLFAVGLMCKPTLVTLPFVLLLLDYWPLGRPHNSSGAVVSAPGPLQRRTATWLHLVLEKVPLLVLSAASCVATIFAQKEALNSIHLRPLQERLANAVVAYVKYIGQMVYPAHLAVFYPYPEVGPPTWEVLASLLFLLTVSVLVVFCRKAYPFLSTGWFWFMGMLVPMIGIVQVGSQPMADRYTYLPEIGLYIAITWGAIAFLESWRYKWEGFVIAGLLIIAALTTRSYLQASYWRNSETLWSHTLDVTHDNYIAQNNLAGVLMEKGQVDKAIAHYRQAVEIAPAEALVLSNLGSALVRKGQVDEGIAQLQKALQIDPGYADAYSFMGSALINKGQVDAAIGYYQKAVQLNTSDPAAYNNLGIISLRSDQPDQAIEYYKKAVAMKPSSAEMRYNLGNAFARKESWKDAIACYTAALSLEYPPVEGARVENNLGVALQRLGKFDEALEHFSHALQLNANYAEAHCNLGRMLAQQGRRDEAVAHLKQALQLRPGYEQAREQLRELGVTMPE